MKKEILIAVCAVLLFCVAAGAVYLFGDGADDLSDAAASNESDTAYDPDAPNAASTDAPDVSADPDKESGENGEGGGSSESGEPSEVEVPVLMYHHIVDFLSEPSSTTVSTAKFREHMEALRDAGYTAVTSKELYDFVYMGEALPEKPVCITFDDGYESNYLIAYPILKELGFKAVIFPIGISVGKDMYKDTEHAMIPHFSYSEGMEMIESGVIDLQSHTYDMHQWAPFESGENIRSNILALQGEDNYSDAVKKDIEIYQKLFRDNWGGEFIALSYPGGEHDLRAEEEMRKNGILITFTTDPSKENIIVRGDMSSLYTLGRHNITEDISKEALLELLD